MKIYTYYEDINFEQQKKMLELWEKSWKQAGFEPVILSLSNAKSHPFYEEFVYKITDIHLKIKQEALSNYGIACFVRWLAYATQSNNEYVYVSDYDCVNNGLEPIIKTDKLHLMDGACPCFVSGTAQQFENLCHLFIDITTERIHKIIQSDKCVWYHDQDFFINNMLEQNNPTSKQILETNNILITRDRINGVGPFQSDKENTVKVLHISHHNASELKKTIEVFKQMPIENIRIQIMESIVNNI
jgi:hypothetical protein